MRPSRADYCNPLKSSRAATRGQVEPARAEKPGRAEWGPIGPSEAE